MTEFPGCFRREAQHPTTVDAPSSPQRDPDDRGRIRQGLPQPEPAEFSNPMTEDGFAKIFPDRKCDKFFVFVCAGRLRARP